MSFNWNRPTYHRARQLDIAQNQNKIETLFISVEEVLNFVQNDLVSEDVMILDSGDTLFIWLGRDSNRQEREAVLTTAKDYLLSDPSGRDVDIPVILVKQGYEPPHFTGFFGAWDTELWPVCSLF